MLVAGLAAAVLLSRGGTAATPDDLAAPTGPAEPEVTAPDVSAAPPDPGRVGVDGVGDVRLGTWPERAAAGWARLGESDDGTCTLYLTGATDTGFEVLAWQVDGVVASVVVTGEARPGAQGRTGLGIAFGDDLAVAADHLRDAVTYDEPVPGAASGDVQAVVGWVGDVEVVASDLGLPGGVTYLELREPAARECRTSTTWQGLPPPEDGQVPAGAGLPELDATGLGPVRYGQAVTELPALGLAPVEVGFTSSSCELWIRTGDDPVTAGLAEVWVRDGVVVGIAVTEGATAEGLAVGEGAPGVVEAFPELAVEGVVADLLPPFPHQLQDGRTIDVRLVETSVMPVLVDAPVLTGDVLVAQVGLFSSGPCQL